MDMRGAVTLQNIVKCIKYQLVVEIKQHSTSRVQLQKCADCISAYATNFVFFSCSVNIVPNHDYDYRTHEQRYSACEQIIQLDPLPANAAATYHSLHISLSAVLLAIQSEDLNPDKKYKIQMTNERKQGYIKLPI